MNTSITDRNLSKSEELLKVFSNLANKSAGSAHPYDFLRWADFLIEVHKNDSNFSADRLKQQLEEQKWPSNKVDDLVAEHEFALALLQAYDKTL